MVQWSQRLTGVNREGRQSKLYFGEGGMDNSHFESCHVVEFVKRWHARMER